MTMSDPIADMLTRIRNANTAKHDTVDVPSSKMKLAIAQILLDEGFIKKFEVIENGNFKTIHITLKYGVEKKKKIITGIKRISKVAQFIAQVFVFNLFGCKLCKLRHSLYALFYIFTDKFCYSHK